VTQFRVKSTSETYWSLRAALQQNKSFVYTRIGDGEMNVMLGEGGGGQHPNEDLARETFELFTRLNDPRNMLGLARHENEVGTAGIFESWRDPKYNQFELPHEFEHATPLHSMALHKPHLLRQFFDSMRDRPKAVVTDQTGNLTPLLGRHVLILASHMNSYQDMDNWYPQLAQHDLIMFACGPAKCAAALRLLKDGRFVQAIDLGSVVDFALNQVSRSWIRIANEYYPDTRKVLLGE
jgi:hypothetical protein